MIIRLYRALDWPSSLSRTKVIAKNQVVLKIPKTAKKHESPTDGQFCQRKTAASCRSRAICDAREKLV